ncbi:MAG: oxidoreductase [Roseivirga sp.]|nr:oxidoreductase [Roseivirga sp.]
MIRVLFSISTVLLLLSCASKKEEQAIRTPFWEAGNSGTTAGFRGLSAVSENVAWASGSGGTVVRTIDGGQSWENVSVPETDTIQFRDIEAFDENTAIVLSAGLPAVIYKTTDGGQNWEQKYFSMAEGTFYDAMDFWDDQTGIAFGDAIDGRLLILRTFDAGESWEELPFENRPQAIDGQGGFAASGTCLRTQGDENVYIGLGGLESSVFYSRDRGASWQKSVAPLDYGPSAGVFSIQFKDELTGILVGGDYNGDSLTTKNNVAYTLDGGENWQKVMDGMEPNGYRSCIDFLDEFVLVVGRGSSDFYREGDLAYTPMEGKYYAVSTSKDGKAAYASGPRGAVARLRFK